ncbi:MAG: diguanylate cyclase, partial [Oxalobacteraceae bacterium]
AFVTGAVLIVAGLSYVWLALAAERGVQLRAEIKRRGEAEQEALLLARTDALTGLVNRREFGRAMEKAIEAAIVKTGLLAVVLIDLDGFKDANDMYGHAAGDTVLKIVAHRLHTVFSVHSTIARLGGDEFAILIAEDEDCSRAMALAEQASGALHQPLAWRNNMISVGASIGIACFPGDGGDASELLHAADIAMYEAKRGAKGGVRQFSPSMEAERINRRLLEQELREGIAAGEIQPFYQPLVRLSDNGLCGFEVLARWQHPRLGLLSPDAFIRMAESTGQITDMTKSILRQACMDARKIPSNLRLSVNISPTQFEEAGLAEALLAIIIDENVSPARVE